MCGLTLQISPEFLKVYYTKSFLQFSNLIGGCLYRDPDWCSTGINTWQFVYHVICGMPWKHFDEHDDMNHYAENGHCVASIGGCLLDRTKGRNEARYKSALCQDLRPICAPRNIKERLF